MTTDTRTTETKQKTRPGRTSKLKINISTWDLPAMTAMAWNALESTNSRPYLFQYGGSAYRLETDDRDGKRLRPLNIYRLRYEVARAADWVKTVRRRPVPTAPPLDVIRDMMAKPSIPLPPLKRLSEIPVFAPDGNLISQPGYHRPSETYYAPAKNLKIPEIPDRPTPEDVTRAMSFIREELLIDFPFVSVSDFAHAIALSLFSFARPLINGLGPNHLIESPTPGSGKGLLADVLLCASVGRHRMAVMAQAANGEEWRKRITASLIQAPEVILIDNITITLDSGELASALTAEFWTDRILGVSKTVTLPVRCIWVTTANNPTLSMEIARRTIRIRLDPKVQRPWERKDFKHSNLKGWASDHRADLVWSGLTLVQNWIASGCPRFTGKTLGSYAEWAAVMGGILETSGIEGFLGNLDALYEATDSKTAVWTAFAEAWSERHGTQEVGVEDLLNLAVESGLRIWGDSDHANPDYA